MLRNFKWFRKLCGGVWVYRPAGGEWCRVTPRAEYNNANRMWPREFDVPGYSVPVPLQEYAEQLGWDIENYSNTRPTLYPHRRHTTSSRNIFDQEYRRNV